MHLINECLDKVKKYSFGHDEPQEGPSKVEKDNIEEKAEKDDKRQKRIEEEAKLGKVKRARKKMRISSASIQNMKES